MICHLLHWPRWVWIADEDDHVRLLHCPKCDTILRVVANT